MIDWRGRGMFHVYLFWSNPYQRTWNVVSVRGISPESCQVSGHDQTFVDITATKALTPHSEIASQVLRRLHGPLLPQGITSNKPSGFVQSRRIIYNYEFDTEKRYKE
jgi:hypothetical protein